MLVSADLVFGHRLMSLFQKKNAVKILCCLPSKSIIHALAFDWLFAVDTLAEILICFEGTVYRYDKTAVLTKKLQVETDDDHTFG